MMRKVQLGQHIRQYGPNIHMHKQGTPTMGGIIFLVALAFFPIVNPDSNSQTVLILAGTFLFGIIGLWDDLLKFFRRDSLGLKARYKFLLQGVAILILFLLLPQNYAHQLLIPGFGFDVSLQHGVLLLWLFLVCSGTTHAFNLTDGLDGLASGIGLIALIPLALIASWQGNVELMVLILIFGASVLAFLLFNRYPARIFMGDTGSFAIGGMVATVAFSMGLELYLLLFALVPVLETLSVALQITYYRFTQRRIFKIAPFHHHFEAAKGVDYPFLLPTVELPEIKITWIFWVGASVSSILGLGLYWRTVV